MSDKMIYFNFGLNQASKELIRLALDEDLGGSGTLSLSDDITSMPLIGEADTALGSFVAKQDLVVCGHAVASEIFTLLDPTSIYEINFGEGEFVLAGTVISTVKGKLRALLAGERTSLNFIQRLCGIATNTKKLTKFLAEKMPGSEISLLDTRKTTPGMRQLEKFAVRVGGGENHRFGLFDAVLIKNNHVDCVNGDVARAITLCREKNSTGIVIEVEVRNQSELEQALSANPDVILLDNYTPEELKTAVEYSKRVNSKILLEASGGITEQNLLAYALSGVDRISLGALTHSVNSLDLSFKIEPDFS